MFFIDANVCGHDHCVDSVFRTSKPDKKLHKFSGHFQMYHQDFLCFDYASSSFVTKDPNESKLMIQEMAWHRTGDRPYREPIFTQIYEATWRH